MEPVETKINGTIYIVTAECSPTATETVEKKLKRLILRHLSDTKSYQLNTPKSLDICEIVCQHSTNIISKE